MMNGHKISRSVNLFAALSCAVAFSACSKKQETAPLPPAMAASASSPAAVWPQMARPQPAAPRVTLQGKLEIHDADTIYTRDNGEKKGYRLWGIDALELGQRCRLGAEELKCGSESRKALLALIAGRDVSCEKIDEDVRKDRNGKVSRRDVSVCYVGKTELNAELVRQGWALDYGQFSKGYYAPLQRTAEANKLGIWQYDGFQKPADYRKRRYQAAAREKVNQP
jgi:endonuclease YncB( thermonuclease family)